MPANDQLFVRQLMVGWDPVFFPDYFNHVEGSPWLLAEGGPNTDVFPGAGRGCVITADSVQLASAEWCRSLLDDCLSGDPPIDVAVDAELKRTCAATLDRLLFRAYPLGTLDQSVQYQQVRHPPIRALKYDAEGTLWYVCHDASGAAVLTASSSAGEPATLDLATTVAVHARIDSTCVRDAVLLRVDSPDSSLGSFMRWCQVDRGTIQTYAFPGMPCDAAGAVLVAAGAACTWRGAQLFSHRLRGELESVEVARVALPADVSLAVPAGTSGVLIVLADDSCCHVDCATGRVRSVPMRMGHHSRIGWVSPQRLALWRLERRPCERLEIELWEAEGMGFHSRNSALLDFGLTPSALPLLSRR